MKRNYLLWSICFGLMSGLGFSQNNTHDAYITGNAKVKVNAKTLFYFGDDLTITEDVTDEYVFENAGNIEVVKVYKNDGGTLTGALKGHEFASTWANTDDYGQVILHQDNQAEGWLMMEKRVMDPNTDDFGQFAVPYDYTGDKNAGDAMNNWFGTSYNNGSRNSNSMFLWNNIDPNPQFDHLGYLSTLEMPSTGYYLLNLVKSNANIRDYMLQNDKVKYNGLPTNQNHQVNWDPEIYNQFGDWETWRNKKNSHSEVYHTYIDDFVTAETENEGTQSGDYGKWIYQYGNPYTSNIDLTKFVEQENFPADKLKAFMQSRVAQWEDVNGQKKATDSYYVATYNNNGNLWAGEKEALIAQPFAPFVMKLTGEDSQNELEFNDGLKTFNFETSETVDPNGKNTNANVLYQLQLKLFDMEGNPTNNKVFVAANAGVENELSNNLESEYGDFGNMSGFYLAQENANGEHVTTSNRKMYINAINTDFVGKPIPLFFNRKDGDLSTYEVRASLTFPNIFTNVTGNFEDGNTFLFYDNDTDTLLPISSDFSYTITPQDVEGARVRYELYWNQGPEGRMGVNDLLAGSTIVYKDQTVHKIRFNKDWDKADVMLYDMSGRRIKTYPGVDTTMDLVLDIPVRGAYVVKVVAENGDVYTQKIIK